MRHLLTFTCLIPAFMSATSLAATNQPCDVTAYGSFPGGQSFYGSFIEDGLGDFRLDWRHSTPGFEFEASETDPDSVSCNINGEINADVIGAGTATVNGVPGYSYTIFLEDNRAAPDSLIVSASIVREPTRRTEGIAIFDPPRAVTIPAAIDVTYGASGPGWTKLHLDDVTCRYRGIGTSYAFQRCTGPDGSDYSAGDTLDVASVRLRIQSADNSFDMTSVAAELGTGAPAPGEPDVYTIEVFNPMGGSDYFFSGPVENGDITIALLPPVP